jgi:hypothetical protein
MLDLGRPTVRTCHAIVSAVGDQTRDLHEPGGIVGGYEDIDHDCASSVRY